MSSRFRLDALKEQERQYAKKAPGKENMHNKVEYKPTVATRRADRIKASITIMLKDI